MQTLADKILDALKKYHKVFKEQTLTTLEEIEATEGSTSGGGYWPSASAVAELNNNLMSRPEWIIDENGKITGYKTQGGADTVFPFINEGKIIDVVTQSSNAFDLSAYDNYRYLVFSANSIPFTVDNNCIYMPSAIICDKNLKFVISAQTTATVKKTNSIYTYSAGSNYKICVLIE